MADTATSSVYEAGHKVRVWWPPTREKKKTDYSGMYWPVKVMEIVHDGLRVQYDNGEEEVVDLENIHPFKPPVDFGEEQIAFQVRKRKRIESLLFGVMLHYPKGIILMYHFCTTLRDPRP